MTAPFRKLQTGDLMLDRVQDNVDAALRPLIASPFADARVTDPIPFPSGSAVRVAHGLGRLPSHWFVLSPTEHATFAEDRSQRSRTFLVIVASQHVTASIGSF